MQVFTTIYLAETMQANIQRVEKPHGLDVSQPGAIEFRHALREHIASLECRRWLESDGRDESN